jgi:riboflavin kinase / FMN adenylyltransferase
MQVHTQYPILPLFNKPVITIGTFDGVHLGHRKIIEQLKLTAQNINGESVLITFEPHPRMVINPTDKSLRLLSTLQEKIERLSSLGIDHLVIIPFTDEFRQLSAEQYISDFLVHHFKPHTIIIGYDHQFGNNRNGNYELLEKMQVHYRYALQEIDKQLLNEITISSTTIRNALLFGDLATANNLLTAYYSLSGTVVHGDARGRTIGYPTANVAVHNSYKLIPGKGVYAAKAIFQGRQYGAMLNIGNRPTVVADAPLSIEVHLFDFNKTIYDEQITIQFIEKMRDEQKFNGLDELIAAIKADESKARAILGKL